MPSAKRGTLKSTRQGVLTKHKKALNPVRREPAETSKKKSGNHELPINSIRQAGSARNHRPDWGYQGPKKYPRAWGGTRAVALDYPTTVPRDKHFLDQN